MKAACRYLGGKARISGWINSFIPPHRCYVEPFGGSAAVLLQKMRAPIEVYNDLFDEVVNYFRILRSDQADSLIRAVELTPYSRAEYLQARDPAEDPVESARRFLVRSMMSNSSDGAFGTRSGVRLDPKRVPSCATDWKLFPGRLWEIAERLRGVYIEKRDAVAVMRQFDSPGTLHYVDPPYLHETRTGHVRYRHEYTPQQHEELLHFLLQAKGSVILSGSDSPLYRDMLAGWFTASMQTRTTSNRLRTEHLWMNFTPFPTLF